MASHNELGSKGEQLAADFLKSKGYEILALNWRHSRAEVDIICANNQQVVFVEVKSRKNNRFGNPEESVSRQKQKLMVRAAGQFLFEKQIENKEIRFDIISVLMKDRPEIEHFEDAFFPLGE